MNEVNQEIIDENKSKFVLCSDNDFLILDGKHHALMGWGHELDFDSLVMFKSKNKANGFKRSQNLNHHSFVLLDDWYSRYLNEIENNDSNDWLVIVDLEVR